MGQPITGHVLHLLREQGSAIVLLENAQEVTASRECVARGMFDRLRVGDKVWYFAEAENGPDTHYVGRVAPILARYGRIRIGSGPPLPPLGFQPAFER